MYFSFFFGKKGNEPMKKIDPVVKKETVYVAVWTVVLTVLMHAVFLILGKWELPVLWGSILGAAVTVLNFLLLGIGVQIAVSKSEEKEAKNTVRTSHTLRWILLVALAVAGIAIPFLNALATILPLLFPQIAMLFRPKFGGIDKQGGA